MTERTASGGSSNQTPRAATVMPAALTKWRDTVSRAVKTIGHTRLMLARKEGERSGATGAAAMHTPEGAALLETQEELRGVWGALIAAAPADTPTVAHEPLDLLALDTPDTRALLDLLEQAQAVAERIDRQRGRCVPDTMVLTPSESRGTDLAETISLIALRVRSEVHGAKSRFE